MFIQKKKITAGEDVNVESEAMDLLFEAEDVAELVAEITGEAVDVTADDDAVVFSVAGDDFTVTPEGNEEVLETARRPFRNKKAVSATTRRPGRPAARKVSANTRNTRMIRKSSK